MGIKNWIEKQGKKTGDKIARLSKLSPEQVKGIQEQREQYFELLEQADPANAVYLTENLIAASSVEIFGAYLPQISELYDPVVRSFGLEEEFRPLSNIRYINITKWVVDKEENSLEKLINVYEVLSGEDCNIALIFHRTIEQTDVYLSVTNNRNDQSNGRIEDYCQRIKDAVKGNFPGSEWKKEKGIGIPDFLDNDYPYSVASCSNIPTEKSEKFISQTIEKLLDGIVPDSPEKEYTIILLATPIQDIEERKMRLAELYSGLAPYASWQTNFTFHDSSAASSSAQLGVNVGASAGVQNGQNQSVSQSQAQADSRTHADGQTDGTSESKGTGESKTENKQQTETESESHTDNHSESNTETENYSETNGSSQTQTQSDTTSHSTNESDNINGGLNVILANASTSHTKGFSDTVQQTLSDAVTNSKNITEGLSKAKGIIDGVADTKGKALAKSFGEAVAKSVTNTVTKNTAKTITDTIGKTITNTIGKTSGSFKSINLGTNFGVNFARSSNVTATIGKDEGITQNFTNYNIKHALEMLEEQMKRFEQSTALGMWDFAAYILSEDLNTANNVAHTYLALTQGETSYMSKASVNLWRGDTADSEAAQEICGYLRELRHPVFALDLNIAEADPEFSVYPPIVTATTALSGKELAYSLNFPRRSVDGLPVIECAEFGRNITAYDDSLLGGTEFRLGDIFHMNHKENTPVALTADSLASHTFITGSTGVGKSNTVYQILSEAKENGVKFLVIEPAKGEYKNVFGMERKVSVYGTNPAVTELLRIDPFSFPEGIHVLEHIDRLVELFNVCWPMYAAMPAVLKNAVENSYKDCGWDLARSTNEFGSDLYPTFEDVARNVKAIIDNSEYDTENKGAYKGSLLTRLNSLTNGLYGLIFTPDELSRNELFDENVIVDLSRVGSSETKSLIMGMLVMKLQEHRMVSGEMNAHLRHITVLEEAHDLLKRTSTEQPTEGGNLLGKSVEMIANAIAEMRTYGEGFIIADQAPGLLDMAAIRNTNTKIILRLPDQSDRELVGKAANLNDDQITELAKLPRGVAAVYQNEWIQPVLCMVDKADVNEERYTYSAEAPSDPEWDINERLRIAEMLSSGTKLEKEAVLRDIRPLLSEWRIKGAAQVQMCRMLAAPPNEPRMTKLAPVMSALFPEALTLAETACSCSPDPEEWTRSVESVLPDSTGDQLRRDIVQCIITELVYNRAGNAEMLRKWQLEGGLK